MKKNSIQIFWFRRDLRWQDNRGLHKALEFSDSLIGLFIFDRDILDNFKDPMDARVGFIHEVVRDLKQEFQKQGGELLVKHGRPVEVFKQLQQEFQIERILFNRDYEPKALLRDSEIEDFARASGIQCLTFKDQVIFEKSEVLKNDGAPYTVFTPYSKKWLHQLQLSPEELSPSKSNLKSLKMLAQNQPMLSLESLGYQKNLKIQIPARKISVSVLKVYKTSRDIPHLEATSLLGIHLRFGTLSIRQAVTVAQQHSQAWLSELIWREFFKQILYHFPHVQTQSFRPAYDRIAWRFEAGEWERWCLGQTGFGLVDAGMRELNATGHMHNRVRMVVASFLTKHMLFHWRHGESYFAQKLLDFDLSANNGNWQWAAGSGCDAAPYFRIFNPESQIKKFDPDLKYVRRWVPEFSSSKYIKPLLDLQQARLRALSAYAAALKT